MARRQTLIAAMLIDTLGGGLLNPFELVYALKVAHLSLGSAGAVLTVAALATIALGPLAGALVDRFGPVGIVAGANCFGAAGCAALLWRSNWGSALACLGLRRT